MSPPAFVAASSALLLAATLAVLLVDAERKGWRVQYLAGGMHPTKISADPTAVDLCPSCRPDKPRADVGLFADGGVR